MLSAPPAFILSQDRTLRSKTRGPCPAPAGCDPALLDFGPPGRSSADQTFGFTRKNDEVLKTQSESTPGLSSGSKQFLASLSSSISSIAVSGFQGSPRGAAAQGVTIRPRAAPAGPKSRVSTDSTQPCPARGPGREKGPARIPRGPLASGIGKCPPLVSGVLLSHGLTPQYHRRSGA